MTQKISIITINTKPIEEFLEYSFNGDVELLLIFMLLVHIIMFIEMIKHDKKMRKLKEEKSK